ncbi:hypothetical protein Desaci_2735 [Desulfosporosinus acidiphilus SJ4]|uniref:Uncharacterized protein n=1 Tax=Desulfosporosinus acidiphilus (strain DSM 22704 / JCM 16185 / SJ4) TaxID=646529 RepID=I4D791_DESAJ|nr:hypothetical protein [Desulfosporosinus acidiphilus]AFM41665.1 hypothetical protein Desaci_2735 [Desulfosporosinus acidiphilus SJ4]
MKKKLRTLLVWILVSLLLQFGGYWLLNKQMQQILGNSTADEPPITTELQETIPGSELSNIQVSYARDYLAYIENRTLKIFNLKKKKVVFEKRPPTANDETLGVLSYQWLPDRNILLYFYARKNPNAITTEKVSPPKPKIPSSLAVSNTEDPNQGKPVSPETSVQPKLEKRYGNPQLTELHSLELPNSDEDTAPDDQLHAFESGSNEFPAGGKIEKFVLSPVTNLIYLTVKSGSTQQLMEIGVMKKLIALSKSQEHIDNMAVSDRYGRLYFDNKVSALQQIIALQYDSTSKKEKRYIISRNTSDRILGVRKGKVYIGEVKNNKLIKIKTTNDLQDVKENPSLQTLWEGSIPFNNIHSLVGANGQIIVRDQQTVYSFLDGHLTDVKLQGNKNYISSDGAELIQVTPAGNSSSVKLQPLKL